MKSTALEILSATGPVASVRVTGASTQVTGIEVITTYSIEQDQPWVTAETVFTNRGTLPRTFWVGDVIDHDGSGQCSGIPGYGTITAGTPADFTPTAPWIGQTGSDGQTYGLLYDQAGFTVYACNIWAMTQRQVTLPPGASFAMSRRIVAIDNGNAADRFVVLEGL